MKQKILIILNRLVIGGQAIDTIPLLFHLKDEFELLVLFGCREDDEEEAGFLFKKYKDIPHKKILNFRRSLNPFRDVLSFFSIFSVIRKFKPDVVHTHGLKSGLMGRVAAYISGTKCIIHTFHGHHFHSYFGPFISKCIVFTERALATITTKIIAISQQQKQEFAWVYKIAPAGKIQVIPLGIDQKLFSRYDVQARQRFRSAYAMDENVVAIGMVGRIVPIKNHALFTKVAAKIIEQTSDTKQVKFFVIGDGHQKKQVQEELGKYGISWCGASDFNAKAQVIFTSWIEDVAGALHGMDVIMLTSHNEGTPLSLIEAQFCGKPVVATNVGGVKDTFADGETGFLVPPGDAAGFTAKLMLLVNDETMRKSMGSKATEFAAINFSKAKEIDSFRHLYQSRAK